VFRRLSPSFGFLNGPCSCSVPLNTALCDLNSTAGATRPTEILTASYSGPDYMYMHGRES